MYSERRCAAPALLPLLTPALLHPLPTAFVSTQVTHASLQKWGSEVKVACTEHDQAGVLGSHGASEDSQRGCDAELGALREREAELASQLMRTDCTQAERASIGREMQQIEADRARLKLRWRRGSD
jgi:hypothetical protein